MKWYNLAQSSLNCSVQLCQPARRIPEVHSKRSPLAIEQHLKIPTSLRRLHHPKRELLPGHFQIRRIVTSDLQEDSAIRPAFVRLPGRMQEPRTEPKTSGNLLYIANL